MESKDGIEALGEFMTVNDLEFFRVVDLKKDFNFINIDDATLYFGVTKVTLKKWRAKGMPYIKFIFGQTVRIYFDVYEINLWADANGKKIVDVSVLQ